MDMTIWGSIWLKKLYSPITYNYTQYMSKTVKHRAKSKRRLFRVTQMYKILACQKLNVWRAQLFLVRS